MISLLHEPSYSRRQPATYFVSVLVHCAIIALVYLVFLYAPRVDIHATVRYDMRVLDLEAPDLTPPRHRSGSTRYPGPLSAQKDQGKRGDEAAHRPTPLLAPHAQIAPQTILQPDLKTTTVLDREIPLPKVVLWSSSKLPTKDVVPPKPQKPPTADVRPQIDLPNQEVTLSDIPLASTKTMALRSVTPASNTTPIVNQQPSHDIQATTLSTTQSQLQPTPAAVMSLSDLSVNAKVALPAVHQTVNGTPDGSLTAGNAKPLPGPSAIDADDKSTGSGNAKTAGKIPGAGTGNTAGLPTTGGGKAPQPGGGGQGSANGSGQTQGNGTGDDDRPTATKIALPPDGRFGAVVVGTSLEDQYPEMGAVWHGRMAYTVYLHVGLSKSWVLQYAIPRTADAVMAGSAGQLDAPWPFNIVRPNLAPGSIDSDALMVHGYINTAGRFESLEVVFPPAFPQRDFVLQSLAQWQFRPAAQDGKPIRTEVLVVIPEVDD
jgi:hypothetical protein